jgi:hypothetical protein
MSLFSIHPAAPPSEVEWEELLVRYELTPRALRAALEDLEDGDADGPARERVGDLPPCATAVRWMKRRGSR